MTKLPKVKKIVEVEGWFATDKGEIISTKQRNKIVKGRKLKSGYIQVGTSLPTKKCQLFRKARLICRAFNGEPPKGYTVDHINNKRDDDRPINLRWLTIQDNIAHAVEQGRRFKKLNAEIIKCILEDYVPWDRTKSTSVIGKKYGVNRSTISSIYKKYNQK